MDLLPKISDIKNLKDLCKVIVLPLLCACYISQSNFSLDLGGFILSINENDMDGMKTLKTATIFIGKTIFSAIFSIAIYLLLTYVHIFHWRMTLPISVLLLLTFGFLGVFADDRLTSFIHIEPIWYYASFVIAFFLLAMLENIGE